MGVLSAIREWVTFAANLCILIITIYTFYITFISCKIKFLNLSVKDSDSKGRCLSVIIENKSLSPLVIEAISLIINNKHKIELKKFNTPLILQPFTAKKIKSKKYSYIYPKINLSKFDYKKTTIEIKTSRKVINIKPFIKSPTKSSTKSSKAKESNILLITNKYKGNIVPELAIYALTISKYNLSETLFIFESGKITKTVLNCSAIPAETIKNEKSLREFLDCWLTPYNIKYSIARVNQRPYCSVSI